MLFDAIYSHPFGGFRKEQIHADDEAEARHFADYRCPNLCTFVSIAENEREKNKRLWMEKWLADAPKREAEAKKLARIRKAAEKKRAKQEAEALKKHEARVLTERIEAEAKIAREAEQRKEEERERQRARDRAAYQREKVRKDERKRLIRFMEKQFAATRSVNLTEMTGKLTIPVNDFYAPSEFDCAAFNI